MLCLHYRRPGTRGVEVGSVTTSAMNSGPLRCQCQNYNSPPWNRFILIVRSRAVNCGGQMTQARRVCHEVTEKSMSDW
jgi:hypothetical protein